jgi:serine/threonine-protein kinase
MSPEQAKGRSVDQRADVWAFGAVLYEMLVGQRCFEGDDVSDTLAAVLRATPAWSALPPDTPPAIRRLLRRCLEKDVRMRLSDMAMVRIELRDAETDPLAVPDTATVRRPSKLRSVAPYAIALLAALVSGLSVWRLTRPIETPQPSMRFAIDLPGQIQLSTPGRNQVAISPDGTHLVYVANERLYLRALSQADAVPIPGTEVGGGGGFARLPFFSPDGQWVAFWQAGQLRKVAVSGGAPVSICNAPNVPISANWGPNDEILLGGSNGILMVKASGGAPTPLISLKPGDLAANPQVLPGGSWLLFVLLPNGSAVDQGQIVVVSRDTGEQRVLIEGARDVRYVPSGHLLYGRGKTLLAQAFDAGRLQLSGGPVPVLDGIANGVGNPGMHIAVSSTGTLLYVPTIFRTATAKLVQIARDGTRSTLADINGMAWFPRFSPDGSRIAYGVSASASNSDLNDSSDLVVLDARGARTRVTFSGNNRFFPIWTRDGTRLTFADGSTTPNRILSALADGSGGTQTLVDTPGRRFPTSWSPDGKTLALYVGGTGTPTNSRDIWMMHVEGDKRTLTPFVETAFEERGPIFSPNGRWIAYTSNKSGQDDVYARPFPGPGTEVIISVGGGQEPVWAPTGRELFYRHDGKLMSVKVQETVSSLIASTPVRLFDDSFRPDISGANGGVANYDISPNGQRFVMVEEPRQTATEPARLQIILNWTQELKQRVPGKK